jgi:hypothetical protein
MPGLTLPRLAGPHAGWDSGEQMTGNRPGTTEGAGYAMPPLTCAGRAWRGRPSAGHPDTPRDG